MKRLFRILFRPLVPDRYVAVFCGTGGGLMLIAGLILAVRSKGKDGLLFFWLGVVCISSILLPRKAP